MSNALQHAIELHQSGRIREAEAGFRKLLAAEPEHPVALGRLGVIAHQTGHHQQAIQLIRRAIARDPGNAEYQFYLAVVLTGLQQFGDAVAAYRSAIKLRADYTAAYNNLGLILHSLGDAAGAEAEFRQAIACQPDFALAWTNLGLTLLDQHRMQQALEACRRAVSLNPQLASAQTNLGRVLLENGSAIESLAHCEEGVRLQPQSAAAHSNLGNTLRALGDFESARNSHEAAIQLSPNTAMLHNNMGRLLLDMNDVSSADTCFQTAHDLDPNNITIQCNRARCLGRQGDFRTAIDILQRAIESNPNASLLHVELGRLYRQTGDLIAAAQSQRSALRYDSTAIDAWLELATYHADSLEDIDIGQMQRLLSQESSRHGSRSSLAFALARAYDSQRQYESAAQHSLEANRLEKLVRESRAKSYHSAAHTTFVDQLIANFDEPYFKQVCDAEQPWGNKTRIPIFIVGMPRSGTTLTEQILASHPGIFGAGELPLASESLASACADSNSTGPWHEQLAALQRSTVVDSAQAYLAQLTKLAPDAERIVEKLPENYLLLGWLATLFPAAHFIHCRRDHDSIALSCWLTSFREVDWANDPSDIRHRLAEYERLFRHWEATLPIDVHTVDYAHTVDDLESVGRSLLDFVGLPWDDACLEFYKTDRPVSTASVSQVRQPIYRDSLDRAQHYRALLPALFPLHETH
jgi:tetratricopeptide (TPR) repeat protein